MAAEDEVRTPTQAAIAQVDDSVRAMLLVYSRDGVKAIELPEGQPFVVGRSWPADVIVADPSVSRRHASFMYGAGTVRVEDLGSKNGSQVNGARVTQAEVRPGDRILIGSAVASIHLVAPRTQAFQRVETYDRFMTRLAEELVRSKSFGRQMSLAMLSAQESSHAHVSRWCARIQGEIRPMDHLAVYGPTSVLLLMPECSKETAQRLTHDLVRGLPNEPPFRVGLAVYPDDATSTEALLGRATDASSGGGGRDSSTGKRIEPGAAESAGVLGAAMRELWKLVDRVAHAEIPVLILGETGTGKEVVATAIHDRGPRSGKPMRSVNCGAIAQTIMESALFGHEKGAFTGADRLSKGIFEQADGGTVFLDEIGELSSAAQAALLRVLETKRLTRVGGNQEIPVDVRILAATHRDLEDEVAQNAFRADLFYRLNAFILRLPPLRARREEILPLAERFLKERAPKDRDFRLSDDAAQLLLSYPWPGNIRELRNVMDRASLICDGTTIQAIDLPERVRGNLKEESVVPLDEPDAGYRDRVREFEVELIQSALRRTGGNQTEAAQFLKLPLRTLVHKIRLLEIKKESDE